MSLHLQTISPDKCDQLNDGETKQLNHSQNRTQAFQFSFFCPSFPNLSFPSEKLSWFRCWLWLCKVVQSKRPLEFWYLPNAPLWTELTRLGGRWFHLIAITGSTARSPAVWFFCLHILVRLTAARRWQKFSVSTLPHQAMKPYPLKRIFYIHLVSSAVFSKLEHSRQIREKYWQHKSFRKKDQTPIRVVNIKLVGHLWSNHTMCTTAPVLYTELEPKSESEVTENISKWN